MEPDKGPFQDARATPDIGVGHVLFTLANFKVSATLGVDPQSTRSYYPVLDTGAGPNMIWKDTLLDKWLPRVRVTWGPTIKHASGRLIRTTAAMSPQVTIGELTTEVDFLVCETLSVPCILGCTFMNVNWMQSGRAGGPLSYKRLTGRRERTDSYCQGPDATREPR